MVIQKRHTRATQSISSHAKAADMRIDFAKGFQQMGAVKVS
jgi:hypothetical protein